MARPTKAAGYGPVRLYKDKRTGYWWARFQYRSQREKLKVVGAGGVPVTRKDVAERHAREIAELLESGQYSKLRNRTAARSKSFADLVEEFIEKGCPQTRRRGGYWSESTLRQSRSTLNLLGCGVWQPGDWRRRCREHRSLSGASARRRKEQGNT